MPCCILTHLDTETCLCEELCREEAKSNSIALIAETPTHRCRASRPQSLSPLRRGCHTCGAIVSPTVLLGTDQHDSALRIAGHILTSASNDPAFPRKLGQYIGRP